MPKKLQIDMTKTFLRQQRGDNLETLRTLVNATGIREGNYRLHLENFLQSMIIHVDRRESEALEED